MKRLIALILLGLFPITCFADDLVTTKYATARSYNVCIRDKADVDLFINSVSFSATDCAASACCKISKDGAALANCTNQPVALTNGCYNITISAAELTSVCQTKLFLQDAAASPRFASKAVSFFTYGDNVAACHQTPDVNVAKWNATTVAAPATAGYPAVTIKDGTGTGEIDTSSGAVVSVTTTGTATTLGGAGLAAVNAEVVDVISVDTQAELSAMPGTSPTIKQMLQWVYQMMRNKLTTTGTEQKSFKNDGTTVLGTSTQSDDGTTFTRGKFN